MKKWIAYYVAVRSAMVVDIAVRQILVDLSDNVDPWKSATDAMEG